MRRHRGAIHEPANVSRQFGRRLIALVGIGFTRAPHDRLEGTRRTEIGEQVQQMADLVAGQLDRMIEGAQTVLVTLGQLPAVRERDPAACNDTLIRLAARFPNVDGIGVVGPDGVVTWP